MDLGDAIDRAIKGDRLPLFGILTKGSKLPGTRANDALAEAFAELVAARGASAMAFALELASLHPDEAPGGGALEFLPMCGVLAVGALGARAKDAKARLRVVAALHDAAEDLRFRVRDAVPVALEKIAIANAAWLAAELATWMDGYFHGAAALRALVRPGFLNALSEADAPVARLCVGKVGASRIRNSRFEIRNSEFRPYHAAISRSVQLSTIRDPQSCRFSHTGRSVGCAAVRRAG